MATSKNIRIVLIHLAIWCCFLLFPLTTAILELGTIPDEMLYRLLTTPLLFYFNFSVLIPKFLFKKKVVLYIILSICFLVVFNYFMINYMGSLPLENIGNLIRANHENVFRGMKYFVPFTFTLSIFLLGGIFRIVLTYFEKERNSKLLETQQREMQLQFLLP